MMRVPGMMKAFKFINEYVVSEKQLIMLFWKIASVYLQAVPHIARCMVALGKS